MNILKLSNGIRVVYENVPNFVKSVSIGLWIGNGSRYENLENNGISHFLEHMLFKGTEKRTSKDIAEEMDYIGGNMNAYTTKEYTCIYTRTLSEHFNIAIDVLADMFINSTFENESIKKEKNVIIEEINMYEDTPDDLVHVILSENIYKNDSLGFPILGTEKTISTFDHDTLKNYYSKNYNEKNTVISVAGNFNEEEILFQIEKHFGNFSSSNKREDTVFNSKYNKCIVTKQKNIEQMHMRFSFPGITLESEKQYTLSVLNTIFGAGMSSRLFQTIREEHGLAYSVYSYTSRNINNGLYSIYAGLNPNQTELVINLVMKEIKKLFTEPINKEQLNKTKAHVKCNFLLELENSSAIMSMNGRSELLHNKVFSPEEISKKIDSVSLEDIHSLTKDIFDFDKLSFSAVGNVEKFDFERMLNNAR